MDADRLDLGPVRVALLRRPGAAEPEGARFADAAVDLLDLPLPVGDEETLGRIGQALAASCQALVLDLEEDELAERLRSDTQLPVVLASRAVLITNTAKVLLAVASLEEPLEGLHVTTGGSTARAVGEVLLELGLPEEHLHSLRSGGDPLPPETDILLVPDADRGKLAGSDSVRAEVGLIARDEGVVLPALVRAAADGGAPLDVPSCAAVAQALADLAVGGVLPTADDPARIPALAEAAAASISGYRAALEALGSPLKRAVRDQLPLADQSLRRLVFVDGDAAAAVVAARRLVDEGLAVPILLGDHFRLETRARERGLTLEGVRVVNPLRDKRREPFAEALQQTLGDALGLDAPAAGRRVSDPMTFAALLIASGEAHGLIAMTDRGDVPPLEGALGLLLRRPGVRALSGAHVVATSERAFVVADTAIAADPTSEELAAAAIHAAAVARTLLGATPRVAFVAHGSADAPNDRQLHRLTRARDLVAAKASDLDPRGPLEADQALSGEAPANVLVAPGKAAAQVLVRSLEQLAGAETIGPFLWGLRTPALAVRYTVTASELELLARLASALSLDAERTKAAPSPLSEALAVSLAAAEARRAAEKAAQKDKGPPTGDAQAQAKVAPAGPEGERLASPEREGPPTPGRSADTREGPPARGRSSDTRESPPARGRGSDTPADISSNELPALEPSDPSLAPLPDAKPLIDLGPIPSAEAFLRSKQDPAKVTKPRGEPRENAPRTPSGKGLIEFSPKEDD